MSAYGSPAINPRLHSLTISRNLPVIAIDFPLFMDGRGFSYGRTLREHFGYKGEVRAIGQFIRDQLYYLSRCGFDAYAIETTEPEKAIESLNDFSSSYSASCRPTVAVVSSERLIFRANCEQ